MKTKTSNLSALSLGALGIVYGDIGTSPLYTLQECFSAEHLAITPQNIYGFIALIFWSILFSVTLKYVIFILQADHKGEGGIVVLLQEASANLKGKAVNVVIGLGLVGAALFYGDAVITPAISVLSAAEGLKVINPNLEPYILPIGMIVLIGLFSIQRFGSQKVGVLFGPVMCLWFLILAVLGIINIIQAPQILNAINPYYGYLFIKTQGWSVFLGLGAVVLALTGAEALYADMGHFGKKPIRLTWFSIVLPCLALNYFGQGALLLANPSAISSPFFLLAPTWAVLPLVLIATLATVIASQAVISGTYSLTRQAIQLGFAPRMSIIHTSSKEEGQIYMPAVNWILLVAVIFVVAIFKSSENLAAAYGLAVTGTMTITSILFCIVMIYKWHWSKWIAISITVIFLCFDLVFFSANLLKIIHGGWLPIMIGLVILLIFMTWYQGRKLMHAQLDNNLSFANLRRYLDKHAVPCVDGTAIFMTGNPDCIPQSLLHNIRHNKVLHKEIVFLTVLTKDTPFVDAKERVSVAMLAPGFHRVIAYYGYKETPNMQSLFKSIAEYELVLDIHTSSFFLSHENIALEKKHHMSKMRTYLFIWLNKNSARTTDYFKIPADRVVELGILIKL